MRFLDMLVFFSFAHLLFGAPSQSPTIKAPQQEASCLRGIRLWYPLARNLRQTAAVTIVDGKFAVARIAYTFVALNGKMLSGLGDCRYPMYRGRPSEKTVDVEMTSNGVTETLTAKELVCFNQGRFC